MICIEYPIIHTHTHSSTILSGNEGQKVFDPKYRSDTTQREEDRVLEIFLFRENRGKSTLLSLNYFSPSQEVNV